MNDNKKWLYDALTGKGVNLGSFDQFSAAMDNEENRKWAYQQATQRGLNVGTEEQFNNAFATAPATQPQPQAQQEEQEEPVQVPEVKPTVDTIRQQPVTQPDTTQVQKDSVKQPIVPPVQPVQQVPVEAQDTTDREAALAEVQARMEREAQEQHALQQANREQVAALSSSIDEALNAAVTESMEGYQRAEEEAKKLPFGQRLLRFIGENSAHHGDAGATMMRETKKQFGGAGNAELQSRISSLQAAKKAITNAERIINEADHAINSGNYNAFSDTFAGGAARGFGDKFFDVSTWDMGMSDMENATAISDALSAYESGTLTSTQQALLDAKAVELATNAYFGSYVGRGYKAGSVTAESIPFMLEMCINPASTIGEAATSRMARYAISRFGKEAAKKATHKALRAAGRAGADLAGAAIMAGTTGSMGVAAETMERMAGDVDFATDAEGKSIFAGVTPGSQEDFGTAFAKAFADRTIENYSEMVGEYFAPLLGAAGKGVGRGMDNLGLGKVKNFLHDISHNDLARLVSDFEHNAKWNGMLGEYAEEVVGNIMNALTVGDMTLDAAPGTGVFNLDQNIDTFLGVSLMGGFLSGAKTLGYRTPKYQARKNISAAARDMDRAFDGAPNWEHLAYPADVNAAIRDVLTGDYTPEQRQAYLQYTKAMQEYEGTLEAESKRRTEPETPEDILQNDLEASYDNGYTIATDEEMNDAKNNLELQRQKIQELLGVTDIDETQILNEEDLPLEQDQRQAALDYLNAKATYDGLIHRIQDDINERIAAANAEVDINVNPSDGQIHPAEMLDGRHVYITGGNVTVAEDGTIDKPNSTRDIIIRDPETGKKEFSSLEFLKTADPTIDPQAEKDAAAQSLREQMARSYADRIDGRLQFDLNDAYQLTPPEGEPFTVQVVANEEGLIDNGDGTVNVIVGNDPRIQPMPKEQLQQMADATRLVRLAQHEQQKAQQEEEAAHPAYSINDELTLDVDGAPIRGSITDISADGIEVYTELPVNGRKVNLYSPEQLDAMVREHNGQAVEAPVAPVQEEIAQEQAQIEQNPAEIAQVEQEIAQPEGPAIDRIPKDEKTGEPIFEQGQVAYTYQALLDMNDGDEAETVDTANQMVSNVQKELEKAEKAKAKGTTPMEIQRSKAANRESVKALQKKLDYWQKVAGYPEAMRKSAEEEQRRQRRARLAEARKIQERNGRFAKEDAQLGEPLSFRDFIMRNIANGFTKFKWSDDPNSSTKGLGSHLGFAGKPQEAIRRGWMLNNETGLHPEAAAEELLNAYAVSMGLDEVPGMTTMDALNEVLDVLNSYDSSRAMFDAAKMAHEQAAGITEHIPAVEDIVEEEAEPAQEVQEQAQQPVEEAPVQQPEAEQVQGTPMSEEQRAAVVEMLEAGDGDLRLADVMNAEDADAMRNAYYDYMEAQRVNEDIIRASRNELASTSNKARRKMAQDEISKAQKAIAEALTPLMDVYESLTKKYGLEQEANPELNETQAAIQQAREEVNPEPSEAQKEAGNYRKGHVTVDGYDISIENAKGSTRSGVDAQGNTWETVMNNDYGYIRRTEGVDGDHIDVFLSDNPEEGNVFVVDQVDPETGEFDEHKVMYGFPDADAAREAYLANYEKDWKGLGNITEVTKDEFKKWIDSSHRKTKPFAEYKSVKPIQQEEETEVEPVNVTHVELPSVRKGWANLNHVDIKEMPDGTFQYSGFASYGTGGDSVGKEGYKSREEAISGAIQELDEYREGHPEDNYATRDLDKLIKELVSMLPAKQEAEVKQVNVEGLMGAVSDMYAGKRGPVKLSEFAEPVQGEERTFDRTIPETQEQAKSIIASIVEFAGKVKDKVQRAVIGGITERQKKDFAEQGIDISDDYVHSIENSAIIHNQNEHGNEKKEAKQGQIAIVDADYQMIPEILADYDSVEKSDRKNSQGRDVIIYKKSLPDGTVYYLEEVRENRKSLSFQTMYKKSGTGNSDGLMQDASPSTPVAPSDNSVSVSGSKDTDNSGESNTSAEISITPAKYTTKKGRTIDMFLVQPGRELTHDEWKAVSQFLKENRGWKDRENGGFMVRSEEQANTLAGLINNPEAVADAQPVSLAELREVGATTIDTSDVQAPAEDAKEPVWKYELHSNPDTGYSRLERSQVLADGREIWDGNWEVKADSPTELKAILENNNMYDLLPDADKAALDRRIDVYEFRKSARENGVNGYHLGDKVLYKGKEATIHDFEDYSDHRPVLDSGLAPVIYEIANWEDISKIEASAKDFADEHIIVTGIPETKKTEERPVNPSGNKLVTDERYEELRRKMLAKLTGQMNMGIDPEILAIGTEMAVYHIEKGARKFVDYAKAMIKDLGDVIRPYLKSFYNAVRDLPEAEQFTAEMTPYDEVQATDTANLGKETSDPAATAETIVKEREVGKQAEEAENKLKKVRNSSRKSVTSQQKEVPTMGDLFAGIEETEPIKAEENELQGNDAERSEGSSDSVQPGSRAQEAAEGPGRTTGQESGRPNSGRTGEGQPTQRHSRHRYDDSVKRNTHNNRVSKGEVVYPKTEAARFKANIEAIRLLKQLQDSGKKATKEQMAVLRQFTGWGGLGGYFNRDWSSEYRELKSLLTDEEMSAAAMSINTAYYTPVEVIDTMWDIAKRLGFEGGNVLEGSAGIGNILASMPKAMSERSEITAVELDNITGGILELLYPDAKVQIRGFEEADVPNGSVDLAITNVPFGDNIKVYDAKEKDLTRKFGNKIHDFCIAKNIRKLAEGGIGIFITTRGTMDSGSKALRQWISDEGGADVIGAFRLNNSTFEGTGATSDIIVVRKRVSGKPSPNAIDITGTQITRREKYSVYDKKTYTSKDGEGVMEYNTYFVEHPENMGGEMGFGFEHNDTFRPGSAALYPTEKIDQSKRLARWAKSFSSMQEEAAAPRSETTSVAEAAGETKEGQLIVNSKGEICMSRGGKAVPIDVNSNKVKGRTKKQVLEDYDALKSAINEVLDYQTKNESDEGLKPLLAKLNKAYDDFVKRYGNLHKNTSISFLRNDVDFASVAAVEDYKETKDIDGNVKVKVKKTGIFGGRVIGAKRVPTPANVRDGIIVSINQFGRIDIPFIAQSLGRSEESVRQEALSSGLGFENPETGAVEVDYEYLSGNVREKLRYAQEHNEGGKYDANIKALEKVIPADIPAHLIEFSLGSDWLPTSLYTEYAMDRFGLNDKFVPKSFGGQWAIKDFVNINSDNEKNRAAGVSSTKWNEVHYGHELMLAAMNKSGIQFSRVIKHDDGTTETEYDKEAMQAASTKIDEMREDFKEWCREKINADESLKETITKTYNDTFNAIVPKEISETFLPEHFEGQVLQMGGQPFNLYPHQAKAVIKATTGPLMMAHEVGTGKTFTLITTAMEMRRLGTAKKPMIVVQNSTLGQFVSSAKALYPNAKVLSISEKDHTAAGRSAFYAKIKYNDWDIIIVPQSVFERIPDNEERKRDFIQEKIDEKMFVIQQAKEAGNRAAQSQLERELKDLEYERDHDGEQRPKKSSKTDAKRQAAAESNAAARAKKQLDRSTDEVADFDDMGIDALLIDEAHNYKHLGFSTRMSGRGSKVKGIDPNGAKRSAGLYLKSRAVFDKVGWKNVVFATGTPISNTAAEIWTFMKYLMPADTMRALHIYYFDDFVSNFGNIARSLEFKTNGQFSEVTRFSGYSNLPELVRIWSTVADTVLTKEAVAAKSKDGEEAETLSDKVPVMEDWTDDKGEVHKNQARDIYLPQSQSLIGIMNAVRAELDRFEKMSGKEKREHSSIPLVMFGIAKKAAIDPRLVDKTAPDEPLSKTNRVVEETLKALKDSDHYHGTAAIFCDNYQRWDTDSAGRYVGFSIFEEIKRKLVEAGVPENQIAIMSSKMSTAAKEKLFAAVNNGDVRVIMGSTDLLGVGVNIQERLFFEAHLDAPNRPMDYTQRMGRIIRQGNLHKEWGVPVRVVRFGVEDSLDVTAYQRLSTKSKFINSVMDGKPLLANGMENRVLEDEEEGEFDNPVAVLSGSQYALLKSQAERELRKLRNKKEQHRQDQIYIEYKLKYNEQRQQRYEGLIEANKKDLAKIEAAFPDGKVTEITIEGKKSVGEEQIKANLKKLIADKVRATGDALRREAEYAGGEWQEDTTQHYDLSFNGLKVRLTADISGRKRFDLSARKDVTEISTVLKYTIDGIDGWRTVSGGINGLGGLITDISDNVANGKFLRDYISRLEADIEHMKSDNELMLQRRGKPFQDEEKLAKQEEIVADYTKKMREELKAKEAKYAEMAKDAKATFSVSQATESAEAEEEAEGAGEEQEDTRRYRDAFHGSPNDFEDFASGHIGEGEGHQSHGYGTYVSFNEGTAKRYAYLGERDRVTYNGPKAPTYYGGELVEFIKDDMAKGTPFEESKQRILNMLNKAEEDRKAGRSGSYWKNVSNAKEIAFIEGLSENDFTVNEVSRNLYTVDIPDDTGDNYIDEDKNLSKAIRTKVLAALRAMPADMWKTSEDEAVLFHEPTLEQFIGRVEKARMDGERFYSDLAHGLGSAKDASEFLSKAGFVGIKYLGGFDGPCAVIFNPDDITVTSHMRFRDSEKIFISNALNAVEGIQMGKATPQQWLRMIDSRGGLKAGEDKWIGLSDWLNNSDQKTITKQEVLDYIAENAIQIEEQDYAENVDMVAETERDIQDRIGRGKSLEELQAEVDELKESPQRYDAIGDDEVQLDDYLMDCMKEAYGDDFEVGYYIMNGEVEYNTDPYSIDEDDFNETTSGTRKINSIRLDYTTPRLENKREIALIVPSVASWDSGDTTHFGDAGDGRAVAWIRFGETEGYEGVDRERAAQYTKNLRHIMQARKEAQDALDRGVTGKMKEEQEQKLANAEKRLKKITEDFPEIASAAPKRILVIDEIQSKRHQEARERGYETEEDREIKEQLKEARVEARSAWMDYENANTRAVDYLQDYKDELSAGKMSAQEYQQFVATDAELARLYEERRRLLDIYNAAADRQRALEQNKAKDTVPDAPFEKNWHELAMKRMIRYAAENGYDAIAWTTGDQQAVRYSIGGSLDSIQRREHNEIGEKQFALTFKNGESQYITTDNEGNVTVAIAADFKGRNLSEIVGKEMAERMLSMEENDLIQGDGLNIGGEGMKYFYDEMLPRFMNKYGKRWGVSTHDVVLPYLRPEDEIMHSVNITPEMAEAAMNGQLMFRIREDDPPKKTGIGYKVFVLKSGRLYPPMVANPGGVATPVGVWLDADAAPVVETSKTGRQRVKAGGKGTQGGSGTLSFRPGWHLGTIPYASQFNRLDEDGEKTLFPKNFVWAEVEYADDVDYQEEAMSYGYNEAGKFQHSLAGLPKLPVNGSYTYRTNPDPSTDPWIITGAMKVNRLLTPSEVDDMVRDAGREPQKRQAGAVTDAQIDHLNAIISDEADNDPDAIAQAAQELGSALGVKVRTVQDVNELTDKNPASQKRMRRSKGWYDTSNGEIVVVVPNAESVADAKATVFHEIVGHKGIREIVGEAAFGRFLDRVYNQGSPEVREAINALAKQNKWDFHEATEEYIAQMAEEGFDERENRTFWEKVRDLFEDMIHAAKLRLGFRINDNDLRYALWRTYQMRKRKGAAGVAEDIMIQRKMKVGEYAEKRFRDPDEVLHDRVSARRQYEKTLQRGMYQFREAVQDSMLGLRELMQAIVGKNTNIEDVDAFENAYLAENAMSSMNKAEQEAYYKLVMTPLLEAIAKFKVPEQEVKTYMMAKHGLERNIVMAERYGKEAFDADTENTKSLAEHIADARKRDYAGLMGLTGTDNVADAEAEANKIVSDFESAHDVTELWEKTNAATKASLNKLYESGLLTKEGLDAISGMYENYVPLRGFDATTSDEVYGYLTDRKGLLQSPLKKAEGRSSQADDPIAYIASMADTAIMQGNRNRMKQRFLNFVLNHPSDLVSVNDIWLSYDDTTDEWKPVFANLLPTDTPEEVEKKVQDFNEKMKGLAESDPDHYKSGKDTVKIPYKIVGDNLREHQVLVKRNGRTYVLTINGNPRAAQALNGLTNPDTDISGFIGSLIKGGQWVNRNLSSVYTTRNVEFVASNFIRDMFYSNLMTWVKESPRYALAFHRNFGKYNPSKMMRLFSKWEKGTLDESNPTENMFNQFMLNGGETGYTTVKDLEKRKKELSKQIERYGKSMPVKNAMDFLGESFDILNRGVENCARFAAFVTSREMGRSIQRSVYDAKEVSVNFNKKGAGDRFVNAAGQTMLGKIGGYSGAAGRLLYVFWNAGVQGLTNFGRAAKRHPGKAIAEMSSLFALGMAVAALAGAGGGDDDDESAYYNLPEYVRRSNICFRVGKNWITLPLPIEFRGLYGLGELAMGVLTGKEHYSDSELAYQIGSQVSQVLPLDMLEGGGGISPFIPSAAKPVVEAYIRNKAWTGMPIYKDTYFNKNMPEWTKAYKSANKQLVELAEAANRMTGGDEYTKGAVDLNPARIEYLLSGYFGGYETLVNKLVKMAETAVGAREFEWRNMLVASRVIKSGDERTAHRKLTNEYYSIKEEAEKTQQRMRGYENRADEGDERFEQKLEELENSPEYTRYEIYDEYGPDIDAIRRDIKEETDPETIKELEAEMYDLMRQMVNAVHEAKNK